MIDKVDVRISEFALPGPALANLVRQLKEGCPIPPFRSAKYYQFSADLREHLSIDAVVHLNCRFGRHTHKVEILQAGKKRLEEMAQIISLLFDVDPWSTELMRVDFTADIADVPVSWFRDNAYFSRKRFSSQIEKSNERELQFIGMNSARVETIYAGKRPVLIRIYNKFGEQYVKYRRFHSDCERFNRRMEGMELTPEQRHFGARVPPTWEEFCAREGYEYTEGGILTRIESQIGGSRRLPFGLKTLRDLRNAHELQPFKAMRIISPKPVLNVDAPPEGVSVRNWLASLGFQLVQQSHGSFQAARSIVIKFGQGNGTRVLESLSESSGPSRPPVDMEEVQRVFRESTLKQTEVHGQHTPNVCRTYDEFEPVVGISDQCVSSEEANPYV